MNGASEQAKGIHALRVSTCSCCRLMQLYATCRHPGGPGRRTKSPTGLSRGPPAAVTPPLPPSRWPCWLLRRHTAATSMVPMETALALPATPLRPPPSGRSLSRELPVQPLQRRRLPHQVPQQQTRSRTQLAPHPGPPPQRHKVNCCSLRLMALGLSSAMLHYSCLYS